MKPGILIVVRLESKYNIARFSGAIRISETTVIGILIAICILAFILGVL